MKRKLDSKNWTTTRIENLVSRGFPDLVTCDSNGRFHLIELKHSTSNAVALSPHQVAFHTRHTRASVWTLVKRTGAAEGGFSLWLYHASQAADVASTGLKSAPTLMLENPSDWDPIFDTMQEWKCSY